MLIIFETDSPRTTLVFKIFGIMQDELVNIGGIIIYYAVSHSSKMCNSRTDVLITTVLVTVR